MQLINAICEAVRRGSAADKAIKKKEQMAKAVAIIEAAKRGDAAGVAQHFENASAAELGSALRQSSRAKALRHCNLLAG